MAVMCERFCFHDRRAAGLPNGMGDVLESQKETPGVPPHRAHNTLVAQKAKGDSCTCAQPARIAAKKTALITLGAPAQNDCPSVDGPPPPEEVSELGWSRRCVIGFAMAGGPTQRFSRRAGERYG